MVGEDPLLYPGRERACQRLASVNVNGLNVLGERRELVVLVWEKKVGRFGDTRKSYKLIWNDELCDGERKLSLGDDGRSAVVWSR